MYFAPTSMGVAAVIALGGCASPGPPLPPTLNLPQVVSGTSLSAMRVGDEVRLHWTTATQTTDKLTIKGAITADICRQEVAAGKAGCSIVLRVPATAGACDAADRLPAALTSGPARLLAYRVQLLNSAGRTAGPSSEVFAVAGETPRQVEDFSGDSTKAGVLLRWRVEARGLANSRPGTAGGSSVELDRTTLDPAARSGAADSSEAARTHGLPGAQKQPAEMRLQAGAKDVGGALDRTAEMGHSYSYTAQRVDVVELTGQQLEFRSLPSQALTFAVRDEFPPDIPGGLVAVPGIVGEGGMQKSTIDLSWEPDVEARLAGYRVYRREAGTSDSVAWVRLGSQLVTMAAYRDPTVLPGHRYAYRVTAVSTAGNESAPSGEVVETAPGP